MKRSIIVAMARNRVIGMHNKLPWHMPADMRYFKDTTKGHTVIMGRKTFASMGYKPLVDRKNIILTKRSTFTARPGYHIAHNLQEAFEKAASTGTKEVFVIGGSQIYAQALPLVEYLYITEIHAKVEGDTYFPPFDTSIWEEISRKNHQADEKHLYAYTFVKYQRKT